MGRAKHGGSLAVADRFFSVPHKARSALLWQLATFLKSLATRPGLPFRRRPGPATFPYNESRAIIRTSPGQAPGCFLPACEAALLSEHWNAPLTVDSLQVGN